MNYHIISLFPETIEPYVTSSILGRAQKRGQISVTFYNPRDFAISAKKKTAMSYADRRVDNKPYGGGPGMVMEAMPVVRAIAEAVKKSEYGVRSTQNGENGKGARRREKGEGRMQGAKKIKIIFFTPAGKQFTNDVAESFKKYTDIIFVCGRYEGIDARVKKIFPMVDISVGPYVLTGGEIPALIMIDAITRRIPGVLGDDSSIEELRIASPDVYTRPEVIEYKKKKYRVPKVLLTGHHKKIDEWKKLRKSK